MSVRVSPASAAERPIIEGLFQFYIYDFSELEPEGSDRFAFDERGQFEPYGFMDGYWGEPDRWPLLIRVGSELAGFALVNRVTHSGQAADWNMAEFFVARKHRRWGVAGEAARQVLTRRPGLWEVAVVERNLAAQGFWPRAIAGAGARDVVELDRAPPPWRGPIWRFLIEASAPG